jgi:putative hydrolase of the HAD superfamily
MKALIWDFDGTLGYRTGGGWTAALLEVLLHEEAACGVVAEQLYPYLQSGFPWHTPDRPHPEIRTARQWWDTLAPVFERAFQGVGLNASQARCMARQVRYTYPNPERWQLFEDTIPTLARLSSQGWTHIVLSNHVPELPHIIEHLELKPYIAQIYNSAQTGYEKPHRRAFQAVLDTLPEAMAAWMIGDSMNADIIGAASAGIPGVLVRKWHKDAKYCCRELAQVPATIEGRSE